MTTKIWLFVFFIFNVQVLFAQGFGEGVLTTTYNRYKLPSIGGAGNIATLFGDLKHDAYSHTVNFTPAVSAFLEQRIAWGFAAQVQLAQGAFSQNYIYPNTLSSFRTEFKTASGLLYFHLDNGKIIRRTAILSPYVFAGVGVMLFDPRGDMKDAAGETYYYWAVDGTLRNQVYNPAQPQNGTVIIKDYKYETDLNVNNVYATKAFTLPLGAGLKLRMNDLIELRIQSSYVITTTDYIDNNNAVAGNDAYLFTGVGLQINIGGKMHPMETLFDKIDFKEIERADSDNDGVRDMEDQCPTTLADVKVDKMGCPLDTDGDGIPDYRDKEINSPMFALVDDYGVAITPEQIQRYLEEDSLRNAGTPTLELEYRNKIDMQGGSKSASETPSTTSEGISYKVVHPYAASKVQSSGTVIEAGTAVDEGQVKQTSSVDKSNIMYRVQIASLGNAGMEDHVRDEYGLKEEIYAYASMGRYKYAVGNFDTWLEAYRYAEAFRNKFSVDCFVIAAKESSLIPVQQAKQLKGR